MQETCAPQTCGSFAGIPSAGTARGYGLRAGLVFFTALFAFIAVQAPYALSLSLASALLWTQAAAKVSALFARPRCAAGFALSGTADAGTEPDWPFYTVLVPLYDEAANAPRLLDALSRLDYPADRLEVLILCEADDLPTQSAVRNHATPPARLVIVPPGGPRTKPNALCHALQGARGDIITIYDAEDSPHPGQLKAAVRAFRADPALVAVQAPLVVDNARPGWVTRQFANEYAALFHVWVPWLGRMGLTVPLGGTSNHVLRPALDEAGGWDAYNVTEDADLSFRLALHSDARFGWIDFPTYEEAVPDLRAWTGQRTRWIKGFAQSWGAHVRPARGWQENWRRRLSLHLTLGLTLLTSLFHVPVLLAAGLMMALGSPPPVALTCLGASLYLSGIIGIVLGAHRADRPVRLFDLVTAPLYWALLTIPAWLAMVELVRKPHYWNKTAHGVSARIDAPIQ